MGVETCAVAVLGPKGQRALEEEPSTSLVLERGQTGRVVLGRSTIRGRFLGGVRAGVGLGVIL